MVGSVILDTVTRAAFPTVWVFSLYLLFAGHNAPGGGFVGGLVAGVALVLRYAGRGLPGIHGVVPSWLRFEQLLGVGLLLAAGTAVLPLVLGDPSLTHYHDKPEVGVLGAVPLGTTLVFDTGVYLIVLGLVLGALEMLGRDPAGHPGPLPPRRAPRPAPTATPTGIGTRSDAGSSS